MRIISIRQGFTSDHSSTSYEFLAVDKPLGREAREKVKSLSRRVRPTGRRAHFVYNADGYDIPGGWEPLMRDYYDVMYSESYDWWIFALAYEASEDQQQEIARYEFSDENDLGVRVVTDDDRVIVSIRCVLNYGAARPFLDEGGESDWKEEDDEETFESEDPLLSLLTDIRKQLIARDYRALYAVWEVYGGEAQEEEREDEEESVPPPAPPKKRTGQKVIDQFQAMLETL